mgnify:CR=1 FL=1
MRIIRHIIFAIYSILWYLKYFLIIKKYFNKNNIINYKIKNFHLWKPNAQYFLGYYKNNKKKVFIKFSNVFYIQREFEAINAINTIRPQNKYFPVILDYRIDHKIPNIVFEYIEGIPLNKLMKRNNKIDKDFIKKVTNSFKKIIITLHSLGLVHRDIRPHNIIVGKNNTIHLIDFTYLIDTNNKNIYLSELPLNLNNRKKLLELGYGYTKSSGIWDDSYSFMKILSDLENESFAESEMFKYLGKLTYATSL